MSDLYEERNGRADRIDRSFAGPGACGDLWRTPIDITRALLHQHANEGDIRSVVYAACNAAGCEYIRLADLQIDRRLRSGPKPVRADALGKRVAPLRNARDRPRGK